MATRNYRIPNMKKTVTMIALRKQYYGRDLNVNDEFEVSPEHAPLLERVGAAKPKAEKSKRQYERRDMEAKSE